MKMKRYVSTDMRSALRAIREEQGPDAVILSTRAGPRGVEVCAAVDVELAAAQGSLAETAALKRLERMALETLAGGAIAAASEAEAAGQRAAAGVAADGLQDEEALWAQAAPGLFTDEAPSGSNAVGQELKSLRSLLEQQLAALGRGRTDRDASREQCVGHAVHLLGRQSGRQVGEDLQRQGPLEPEPRQVCQRARLQRLATREIVPCQRRQLLLEQSAQTAQFLADR